MSAGNSASGNSAGLAVIERLESNVRSYVRSFPVVFTRARGATLIDREGREYVDFFAGAGALSYGHNPPPLREAVVEYLLSDGIVHGLDLATDAKVAFLERFEEVVLRPRKLDYKVQFPGPTGTNAVEAALKLARRVTGRHNVIFFTNAFHGVTSGSLAVTGNRTKRRAAGLPLTGATPLPYDGYLGPSVDTLSLLARVLEDSSSGVDLPAAVIVETLQAEGGVNLASARWLQGISELCRRHGALLIVDDVQVGCGRTGSFFSFDRLGFTPDLVVLSKAISGMGLPLSLLLIREEFDRWQPGEHNGTFRGNNLAFVAGRKALDYWSDERLAVDVERRGALIRATLSALAHDLSLPTSAVRGRGMIAGIELGPELAGEVSRRALDAGVLIETSGNRDQVLKVLPPLVIADDELAHGLELVCRVAREAATQ